jgi:hypothetical protein
MLFITLLCTSFVLSFVIKIIKGQVLKNNKIKNIEDKNLPRCSKNFNAIEIFFKGLRELFT